jgi:hypothetical protein
MGGGWNCPMVVDNGKVWYLVAESEGSAHVILNKIHGFEFQKDL